MTPVSDGLATEAETFLAGLPPEDAEARFLREEFRVAIDALRLGVTLTRTGERWAAFILARVVVETAIRLAWVSTTTTGGLPDPGLPDPEFVRKRLGRIVKRDFQQLLAASDVAEQTLSLEPIVGDPDKLRAKLGVIEGAAAPDLRTMAGATPLEGIYFIHRLCSAATHPGFGTRARIAEVYPAEEVVLLLEWSFSAAAIALLRVADVLFNADPQQLKTNLEFFWSKAPVPQSGKDQSGSG